MATEVRVPLGDDRYAILVKPGRKDFDDNLSGAVQYAIANVIIWVAEWSGKALGTFGGFALVEFLERIEPGLVKYYEPMIDTLLDIPELPEWFRSFLEELKSPKSEAGAAVLSSVLGSAAGGATGSLLGSALALVTYAVNRQFEPARPTVLDALVMEWREAADPEKILGWLKDQGWQEEAIAGFRETLVPRPDIGTLLGYMWRAKQDPNEVRAELGKRGYLDEDTDKFMELAHVLPGIADIIRMAVREAFDPEAIAHYQLKERYPDLLTEFAEKQGLDKEWAERYWYAHWVLPSPTLGYEMFQRGVISEEELRDLLIYADYVPWWVDKMIEVAYVPFTRVDTRRMHKLGVLGDADLIRAYMDIGYDREKATKMAEFTIALNMESEKEATKAEILKGYRLGMLGASETQQALLEQGLNLNYVLYLLALEDYKRATALVDEKLTHLKTLYVGGEINRSECITRLGALALESDRMNRYIEMWDIAREAKTARPTVAMIEEYYKDGIIDEATARGELDKRHYEQYVIEWIIEDWDTQIAVDAAKATADAQKEQERVRVAKFKTDRLEALARIGREIAELKQLIAEWKVAKWSFQKGPEVRAIQDEIAKLYKLLWEVETDEERAPIYRQIEQLDQALSVFQEQVALIEEKTIIAQFEIAKRQAEKAALPITPKEEK